jgi:Flp pilus assembly protein TadG
MSRQNPISKRTTSAMRQAIRNFMFGSDGIAGAALIEMAAFLPVIVVLIIGTIDFGLYIYSKMEVQHSAQAGAQYAIEHGFSSASIQSAVTNATAFRAANLQAISASSPAPSQFCGCPSPSGVTSAAGSPPCSSKCSDGSVAGTYVTVAAKATYTTLLRYPLFHNSSSLVATSTVRIQ